MTGVQQFDYSVDVVGSLLWRHNKAEHLQTLLAAKQAWYDDNQTSFWENWLTDVFDLRTANQFGLVVWGIILGIPLAILLDPDFQNKLVFGFKPFASNFGRSNFAVLSQTVQPLTLEEQRILLQIRYLTLFSRCTVPEINRLLKWVFLTLNDYGVAYVKNHYNMTMTYKFTFDLPGSLGYYFRNYDILPRPAGVSIAISEP